MIRSPKGCLLRHFYFVASNVLLDNLLFRSCENEPVHILIKEVSAFNTCIVDLSELRQELSGLFLSVTK